MTARRRCRVRSSSLPFAEATRALMAVSPPSLPVSSAIRRRARRDGDAGGQDQLWSRHMSEAPIALVEFPADDVERAQRFWRGVLGVSLEARTPSEGQGWQTHAEGQTALGLHARGPGPGDRVS